MNSGSESGHAQHRGQVLHRRGAAEGAEPLVEQGVDEAADHGAEARAGAAEDDHHEQREREVGGRHLGRGAADQEQPDDAARRSRGTEASTNETSLKG